MTGQVTANLDYDAFGREIRATGTKTPASGQPPGLAPGDPWVDNLPFHFSTKFTDRESGLNYYGYRFYDPVDGRWLNRDPIGEAGGHNLYGIVKNNAVNWIDLLGLRLPDEDLRELDKIVLALNRRHPPNLGHSAGKSGCLPVACLPVAPHG
jgi:RHS repeat-associated protein